MESPGKTASDGPQTSQVQATADLYADLRKMINNRYYSDIVFECQDKERVWANRMLLMARCPRLGSLIKNEEAKMSSSRLMNIYEPTIPLSAISSSALLSIFQFLYTGTIDHAAMSLVKAYEVLNASMYLELPKMEVMVREFFVNSPADVPDDISKAALRLSVELEFGPGSGTIDAIPVSLIRILNSEDLEPIHFRGLSDKAFRYFLQRTKSTTNLETLSFGEYLRFRKIILWCTTLICPDEAALILKSLPDARSAAILLRGEPKIDSARPTVELSPEAGYLKSLLVKQPESAALVDSLPTIVDFRRVHTALLEVVVEPLKVVPETEVNKAIRFQFALYKNMENAKAPQYQWEHGSSYAVVDDGYGIAKNEPEVGFARFSVPMACPYGVYEWDIIVEELCTEFCEIGFHYEDGLDEGKPNFTGTTLAQQPTGWALRHDLERGTGTKQRGSDDWVLFKKDFAHKDARVRVHLDMLERRCKFSVDKDEYFPAWTKLPYGVFYPAVSLGDGTMGRVRIELVSGFEML